MKDKKYYIGQILERCNKYLLRMMYWADQGKTDIVHNIEAQITALLGILEDVFKYNTKEIREKIIIINSIATENDYFSCF